MTLIEQRSIADQLYAVIKRMILSGEIKSGEAVLEEKIAQDFNVSRTPVREAIKRLAAYGLLQLKPRGRAEVIRLNNEEAHKLAIVRVQIECLVVELLAEHADQADCQHLRQLAETCENSLETGDIAEIFERDSRLHLAMARATDNQYLYEILERLDAKVQLYRITTCLTLDKIGEDVEQHRTILDAICDGNVEKAKESMKAHVLGLAVIKT